MIKNNYLKDPTVSLDKYFSLFNQAFDEIFNKICKKTVCTSFSWNKNNYKIEKPRCDCVNENQYVYHSPRGFGVELKYFQDHPKFSELLELEKIYPLEGNRIFRFIVNSGGDWPIHRDKHDNKRMYEQLMFPLRNCDERTKTRWYNLKHGNFKENSKVIILNHNEDTELEILHEDSLMNNIPKIINVGEWHNVVNYSDVSRVVVGFYIG